MEVVVDGDLEMWLYPGLESGTMRLVKARSGLGATEGV